MATHAPHEHALAPFEWIVPPDGSAIETIVHSVSSYERGDFDGEFLDALASPNLEFPSWLAGLRSSRKIQIALSAAGLPTKLLHELSICALTLWTMLGRAPPVTNKQVSKSLNRLSADVRRARSSLGPPNFPPDIESRLPVHLLETVNDDGISEFEMLPSPIDVIRSQLDELLDQVERLERPPPARHGPRLSQVANAVEVLVAHVLECKPDIAESVLIHLARTVLEPAHLNGRRPDDSGVDWRGQVRRAIAERRRMNLDQD